MTESDPKSDLHRYLQTAREALVWRLDGVSEYDIRRPLVPTGTNLLGLVKHVASVEAGYYYLPQRLLGHGFQLDENRCVSLEMRDRKDRL